jgi:hypothetical protein
MDCAATNVAALRRLKVRHLPNVNVGELSASERFSSRLVGAEYLLTSMWSS